MAVTLEEIAGWLEKQEFKHKVEDEKIILMTGNEDHTNIHVIKAKDDGRIFEWKMNIVDEEKKEQFKVKEHKYLPKLLSYLLQINYQTKFGTWEFDPKDGEIAFNVEIPLEDAVMTFEQFKRICSLTMDTSEYTDNIRLILETGEPKEDNSEAELMARLEQLLAAVQEDLAEKTAEDDDSI